ncbi:hypothetical protein ACP4OV_011479 [Aristida adscensionis]
MARKRPANFVAATAMMSKAATAVFVLRGKAYVPWETTGVGQRNAIQGSNAYLKPPQTCTE